MHPERYGPGSTDHETSSCGVDQTSALPSSALVPVQPQCSHLGRWRDVGRTTEGCLRLDPWGLELAGTFHDLIDVELAKARRRIAAGATPERYYQQWVLDVGVPR